MTEADLRLHLAQQTKKEIALFDVLKLALPEHEARTALDKILAEKPDAVLFDALYAEHLKQIGGLIDAYASREKPLFSIGSSSIEAALAAHFREHREISPGGKTSQSLLTSAATNVLIGSGSCSPVTTEQIAWALKHGFFEVTLSAAKLAMNRSVLPEINRAADAAAKMLRAGRSVIVHTARRGADKRVAEKLKGNTAQVLGAALGKVLRGALERGRVRRVCMAGGDTSSFAARALGIEALEMIASLTPGAPLCRAYAPGSPADGCDMIFKGGQVGAENYFEIVRRGRV